MRRALPLIAALGALSLTPSSLTASENCTEDAMLVFDGSGSMSEMGFNELAEPRIFEARRAIREAIPQVTPFRRVGLILYGPGPQDACSNIDLRFPPMRDASERIVGEIDAMIPEGDTPLTASVAHAAKVLDYRHKPGVIVLVTDGKETCEGLPCQLAAELAADAENLTVHVVGFKVRGYYFDWDSQNGVVESPEIAVAECLAERTGGKYIAAENADELVDALRQTLGCQIVSRLHG